MNSETLIIDNQRQRNGLETQAKADTTVCDTLYFGPFNFTTHDMSKIFPKRLHQLLELLNGYANL